MTVGYGAAHAKAVETATAVREIAGLIGEPAEDGGLGMREDAVLLELRATDLERGLFKVVVVGEFKNGKSTLLNAMLGSKMLPARATPSTAIITVLTHGAGNAVQVYETGKVEPRVIGWEDFIREFQLSREDQETLEGHGTLDRFREVEYAQIECRHSLCAHGVKLVDSPGLGEHLSRTRVATRFLRQAQAVIVVLNATRILSRDEREFVDTLLGPGLQSHIFFVVNRINQVDRGAVEEIRDWVKGELTPYFVDRQGSVDESLYRRRVFFVDAKSALDLRMRSSEESAPTETGVPTLEAELAQTGVPALEAELERFLTGGERVLAALQSTVRAIEPVVMDAQRRIAQERTALEQPLEELEGRRQEADGRLLALQARKSEIERTVLLFGDEIKQKIYADLRRYVDEMHESWPEDSRRVIDLDSAASATALLAAAARRESREQLASAIGEQIQHYLRVKFAEWTERVPAAVRPDVEMMVAELEAQVDEFQIELDEIAGAFAGSSRRDRGQGERPGERIMQLALTLSDIGEMTEELFDPGDWTNLIGRMAQQAVAVLVVGTLVTGGNFLIALVLVEAFHLGLRGSELKRRLREMLGDRLHQSLQEQVAERRPFIHESVERRFHDLARSLTEVIQGEIDEVRAEQERIVRQKSATHFSMERESERLHALSGRLSSLLEELHAVSQPSHAL